MKKIHNNKKKWLAIFSAFIVFSNGLTAYAAWSQTYDLSGWFYFDDATQTKKTGWFLDSTGYWYYLNPEDGFMVADWTTIDGKEYYFQPVADVMDYPFGESMEQHRQLYLQYNHDKIPFGALYVNTITLDGSVVGEDGSRIIDKRDYNEFVGDYAVMEEPDLANVYWGGVFEISRVDNGRVYGTFSQSSSASYAEIEVDFTNGTSIYDGHFNMYGYQYCQDSNLEAVRNPITIACKFDTVDGKPLIRTTGSNLNQKDIFYKTKKPIEYY